jgi:hypothetical protein
MADERQRERIAVLWFVDPLYPNAGVVLLAKPLSCNCRLCPVGLVCCLLKQKRRSFAQNVTFSADEPQPVVESSPRGLFSQFHHLHSAITTLDYPWEHRARCLETKIKQPGTEHFALK